MTANARALPILALLGALALGASDALAAAGCYNESEAKNAMAKMMREAHKLAAEGDTRLAWEKLKDAQSMNACPVLSKECKEKVEGFVSSAKETIEAAGDLGKNKEAGEEEVLEALRGLCRVQLGWRASPLEAAAAKAAKKLKSRKKKLLKQALKDADKEVAEQVEKAGKHLRDEDIRSALACYDVVFTTYPYSKKARRYQGDYLELKRMVKELDAEEAAERERAAGK